MRRTAISIVLAFAACVRSEVVICEDGRVCPIGTLCAIVTNPYAELCVQPDQIAQCKGVPELTECGDGGRCYGGVCLPAGCGNLRLDPGEVCDEGNVVSDTCSADCLSNQTCGNRVVDPMEDCDDGFRDHDGCASSCRFEEPRWIAEPNRPMARIGFAIAYDARRNRIVLFGGYAGGPVADTWEWDGQRWRLQTPPISPGPRHGHVMAYDARRGVVVMFGGVRSQPELSDTWEWDGMTWRRRSPPVSPGNRQFAEMTYDAARHRMVLFGGYRAGVALLADTWAWDGTTWTELATNVDPAGRWYHGLTYDPRRDAVVMFGGLGEFNQLLGDTWELRGTDWTAVTPSSAPAPRYSHAMEFDPIDGRVMVTSGAWAAVTCTMNCVAPDTWAWDGVTWTYRGTAPGMTHGAIAVPFAGAPLLLGFGQDTYRWSGQEWTLIDYPFDGTLLPRREAAAAVDISRRRVLVYGGLNSANVVANDTWIWDGAWSYVPSFPNQGRRLHAMAYHAAAGVFVMFGGLSTVTLGETWVFDASSSWQQQITTGSPPPRFGASMAYDEANELIVMFGGRNPSDIPLAETWLWNQAGWTAAVTPSDMAPRTHSCMTYDPVRRRVVLFGGLLGTGAATQPTDELWEWDGVTWTKPLTSGGPLARSVCALSWDAARQRVVLVGGRAAVGGGLDDVWEWDGTSWRELAIPGLASPRYDQLAVSDLDGAGVLVFSGVVNINGGDQFANDTVDHLRWDDVSAPIETCTRVDIDGDGFAGCQDPDCWARCSPRCPPYVATCTVGPRCGDATCDPNESCDACPDDCAACEPRCGNQVCDATETIASCPGDCTP